MAAVGIGTIAFTAAGVAQRNSNIGLSGQVLAWVQAYGWVGARALVQVQHDNCDTGAALVYYAAVLANMDALQSQALQSVAPIGVPTDRRAYPQPTAIGVVRAVGVAGP